MITRKIVGIFSTEAEAIRAIERLKRDGYADSEISVVAKDVAGLHDLKDHTHVDVDASEAADGAIGGAMTGGAIGGIGALLVELGLIAIPGVGPFLAAGPIAAAIGGALAGGAVGGILGALVDLGLPEEEARGYEEYINRGDILVMVDENPDRDVYGNFYENNSVIRDTYDGYVGLGSERDVHGNYDRTGVEVDPTVGTTYHGDYPAGDNLRRGYDPVLDREIVDPADPRNTVTDVNVPPVADPIGDPNTPE